MVHKNKYRMKKFAMVLITIIFVGCSANVNVITGNPPEGFTKAYIITDQSFAFEYDMKKFVDNFKTDEDVVIQISDLEYLILRG